MKKGIINPFILVAVVAVVGIFILSGGALQNLFSPAALITETCYKPGDAISVQTDPIVIEKSSASANYCAEMAYYDTNSVIKYSFMCSPIGSVTSGQTLQGRTIQVSFPADGKSIGRIYVYVSVSSFNGVTNMNSPEQQQLFAGLLTPIDADTIYVGVPKCGSDTITGTRNVYYFTGCDNSNPNQGKMKFCVQEAYTSVITYCSSESFVYCEQNAVCQSDPTGKIGGCFSKTGGSFGMCGDNDDNMCPGYDAITDSSSCQPYQDRDCCMIANGNWNELSGIVGGNRCYSGKTPITSWDSSRGLVIPDFITSLIGGIVLGFIIVTIVLLVGLIIRPLGMALRSLYNLRRYVIASVIVGLLIVLLFTGSALATASLVGI